jgi:membrane fusion protein (multidrug efflux system)
VTSLIDGVAGIAKAQIGNLVGPGATEELTTVSTVNPIKIYAQISEQEYMKAMGTQTDKRKLPLELILADGRIYPHKGEIAFADRQVDVRTGTIRVAALFPNPGNLLRPGQFAKIRAMMETKKGALLIPQRSVTEMQGKYLVAVISSDNKVSIRPVKATEKVGSDWIIEEGLTPQDRIVAEGIQKVKEGLTINPKPFIAEAEKKQETPSKTEAKPAAPAQAEKR